MTTNRRVRFWIWCSFGVTLLVVLAVAAITPLIVDKSGLRRHIAEELTRWSGGRLTIRGRISLSYYPEIRITARNIVLVPDDSFPMLAHLHAQRLAVTVRWADILTGESKPQRIALHEPRFRLRPPLPSAAGTGDGKAASQARAPLSLLDRLASAPFSVLEVRDGRIVEHRDDHPNANLAGAIIADLSFNTSRDRANLKASVDWRAKKVALLADVGVRTKTNDPSPRPISATLNTPLLTLHVHGLVDDLTTSRSGVQVRGESRIASPDLRALASWLGYDIAGHAGLRDFSAEGTAVLKHSRIEFDAATIRLDGNTAQGALALSLNDGRPMAQGTLALDKLNLLPYSALGTQPNALALRTQMSDVPLFDPAVLRSFDLDLRISAGELLVAAVETGRIGMTISLRQGQFNAEFAEVDMFEGRATGHIGLNARADVPKLTAAVTFRDVDLDLGLRSLFDIAPLSGKGDIGIDLATSGRSFKSWRSALEGTVTASLTEEAELAIDVPALIAAAREGVIRGWPDGGGRSALVKLDCKVLLKSGSAYSETIRFGNADWRAKSEGIVDLPGRQLNVTLEVIGKQTDATTGKRRSDRLIIEGPIAKPTIRLSPRTPNTDRSSSEFEGFASGSTN